MTSLTSQVCTLYQGREAGIAALEQLVYGVGLYVKNEVTFGKMPLQPTEGGIGFPIGAPSLSAEDVASFGADYLNRGYPAFQDQINWFTRLRLAGRTLETVYPEFRDVLQGPLDVLITQLFARALSQSSERYWVSGRRRIRSSGASTPETAEEQARKD